MFETQLSLVKGTLANSASQRQLRWIRSFAEKWIRETWISPEAAIYAYMHKNNKDILTDGGIPKYDFVNGESKDSKWEDTYVNNFFINKKTKILIHTDSVNYIIMFFRI